MAKFYKKDSVAEEYDYKRFEGKGGEIIKRRENNTVLRMLGDLEGKKVLDLGAGTGRYSIQFALEGADVTALDLSEEMLDIAKAKAKKAGVKDKILFKKGDAKDTDFDDESFDIVTSMRVFHLIDDPKALFQEMKRITKERVLFDFFNLWSLRLFYNKFMPMNSKLRRKRRMRKLLERNGFYNIQIQRDFFFPYATYRFTPGMVPTCYSKMDSLFKEVFPFKRACSVIYLGGRKS